MGEAVVAVAVAVTPRVTVATAMLVDRLRCVCDPVNGHNEWYCRNKNERDKNVKHKNNWQEKERDEEEPKQNKRNKEKNMMSTLGICMSAESEMQIEKEIEIEAEVGIRKVGGDAIDLLCLFVVVWMQAWP